MTCGEPVQSCAMTVEESWSRFNSCWGMRRSKQRNAIWAANGIFGHPVNDLFDLRMDAQYQLNFESTAVQGHTTVELASRQELECGHGGSEHDQPFQAVSDARQLSLPERTGLVEIRKSNRPQSLRRCSEPGASRGNSGSKTDGQPDHAVVGSVGLGILPDSTP